MDFVLTPTGFILKLMVSRWDLCPIACPDSMRPYQTAPEPEPEPEPELPAAMASTEVTAIDGVPGMTTYRLVVSLGPGAASIFSIFGDSRCELCIEMMNSAFQNDKSCIENDESFSTLGSMNFPAAYQAKTVVDQVRNEDHHSVIEL